MSSPQEFIGVDVGEKRVGIARVNTLVGISEALTVLDANDVVFERILAVAEEYGAAGIVVGLPRGLDAQETAQTNYCQEFARELAKASKLPVYMIDEAGSSKEADKRLRDGVSGARDSIAAGVFLEDFVRHTDTAALRVVV